MRDTDITRPAQEVIDGFRELLRHYESVTCAISDSMDRFNAMTADMKPLFDGIRFAGTAVTVKTLSSDLAAVIKAIDVCLPGDVIVIDTIGCINTAFWGENMTMSALNQGVADPKVGERIKAIVVLKESARGVDAGELVSWCRERLAFYKVPQYIEFRDMLPKSKVGKLLRREIRDEERRRQT